MTKSKKSNVKCQREVDACIEGDKIRVQCMKGGKWRVRGRSNQHKGHFCVAEKDAKAFILKAYTNIRR